jgi:hypothetical protein
VEPYLVELNTTYREYKESTHISDNSSDQSTQLGHFSHCHSRSEKTATPQCRVRGKVVFLVVEAQCYRPSEVNEFYQFT